MSIKYLMLSAVACFAFYMFGCFVGFAYHERGVPVPQADQMYMRNKDMSVAWFIMKVDPVLSIITVDREKSFSDCAYVESFEMSILDWQNLVRAFRLKLVRHE